MCLILGTNNKMTFDFYLLFQGHVNVSHEGLRRSHMNAK